MDVLADWLGHYQAFMEESGGDGQFSMLLFQRLLMMRLLLRLSDIDSAGA